VAALLAAAGLLELVAWEWGMCATRMTNDNRYGSRFWQTWMHAIITEAASEQRRFNWQDHGCITGSSNSKALNMCNWNLGLPSKVRGGAAAGGAICEGCTSGSVRHGGDTW
jgi:hypothetical protein